MRKLILSMSMSLDGYVAGPSGDNSWQDIGNEENWKDLFAAMEKVDLYVLGAGMWPEYSQHWKNVLVSKDQPKSELDYAKLAEKTKHIIFSKNLKDAGWENAQINTGELYGELKKLKAQDGGDIMSYGGASFARSLLETGLVDEYRLVVNPVVLAGGKSLFHGLETRHNLKLAELRQYGQVFALSYKQIDPEN